MTTDRPELTTLVPADPRLAQLPQGEVIYSLREDGLYIERADPQIVIGIQLLELMRSAPANGVELILARGDDGCSCSFCVFLGAVVKIRAINQVLVYRVVRCLPWYCGFIAEWPD